MRQGQVYGWRSAHTAAPSGVFPNPQKSGGGGAGHKALASITVRFIWNPPRGAASPKRPLRQRRFAFGDDWQLRQDQKGRRVSPNPTWLTGVYGIRRLDPVASPAFLPENPMRDTATGGCAPAFRDRCPRNVIGPQGRGCFGQQQF